MHESVEAVASRLGRTRLGAKWAQPPSQGCVLAERLAALAEDSLRKIIRIVSNSSSRADARLWKNEP